jgi:hypothetical protein
VHFEAQVPITAVGTCAGVLFVRLPVEPISSAGSYHLSGREDGATGATLVGFAKASVNTNSALVTKYDGTTCAATNAQCNIGGTYQVP